MDHFALEIRKVPCLYITGNAAAAPGKARFSSIPEVSCLQESPWVATLILHPLVHTPAKWPPTEGSTWTWTGNGMEPGLALVSVALGKRWAQGTATIQCTVPNHCMPVMIFAK